MKHRMITSRDLGIVTQLHKMLMNISQPSHAVMLRQGVASLSWFHIILRTFDERQIVRQHLKMEVVRKV